MRRPYSARRRTYSIEDRVAFLEAKVKDLQENVGRIERTRKLPIATNVGIRGNDPWRATERSRDTSEGIILEDLGDTDCEITDG